MGTSVNGDLAMATTRLAGILRAGFAERMAREPWVAEHRMRPPMYAVLRTVVAWQPVSQREVSDYLGVHPSDLVAVVDALERSGWLRRERAPDDRRRYDLRATDEGRAALERLDRIAADAEAEALAGLAADEVAALRALVTKAVAAHLADSAAELASRLDAPAAPPATGPSGR